MKGPYYQHISDYFRLCFTDQGVFEDVPRYIRWTSSLPIFNLNGLLTKQELTQDEIEQNLAIFKKLNQPHWWILHEMGSTSKALEKHGYRCIGHLGFVTRDLSSNLPDFPEKNNRVHVRRVSNDEDLKLWCSIICETFFPGHPQQTAAFLFAPYQKIGYAPHAPISHYLGFLDGEPVGGSSVAITNDTLAGMWNAAVLERGRRQGVGTAMAACRIKEAADRGVKAVTSILMPDGMAWSYCKPFGFTETFKAYPFLPTRPS